MMHSFLPKVGTSIGHYTTTVHLSGNSNLMKKVLVVDDDCDLLVILKAYLNRKGFEVMTCVSCKEGMEAIDKFRPDFILLDINVGDEDGRDLCRTISQAASWSHIPVIMISANHEQLSTVDAYGAKASLQKPFELERVVNVLM